MRLVCIGERAPDRTAYRFGVRQGGCGGVTAASDRAQFSFQVRALFPGFRELPLEQIVVVSEIRIQQRLGCPEFAAPELLDLALDRILTADVRHVARAKSFEVSLDNGP